MMGTLQLGHNMMG